MFLEAVLPGRWAAFAIAAAFIAASPARAVTPIRFSGELGGIVTDGTGKAQSGAVVLLLNRQDRILQKSSTDAIGTFAFADLLPDVYSVKVSLASFLPAMKERIQIRPGMRSLLEINLSHVFSSIQLVSTTPAPGGLMSDNWKWALRAQSARRPVLRILAASSMDPLREPAAREAVFSGARGLIKLSATDGAQMSGAGEADLGTQFAFATSVYGGNHVGFSGDLGYGSATGSPSAAFRTTYSRDFAAGVNPEVSVTMRQIYVPMRIGQALASNGPAQEPLPALRTLAISFTDKARLTEKAELQYGFELNNVSFIERLHYFSPYAKLTFALGRGTADFSWTSGNARPELGIKSSDNSADLQRSLTALAVSPSVTLENGHAKVQRSDAYEAGITQRFSSREYRVSGYHDRVTNTALTIASPDANLYTGDLLPDLFSHSALFNLGKFETFGYAASITQDLGDSYKVALIYGSAGVLAPRSSRIGDSAEDLRANMRTSRRPGITLRTSGAIKATGTRFTASYQWTDYASAIPGPAYSTQSARPDPGLNVIVRQPIPAFPGMHGRMEATAEMRNLMAQGYLPLTAGDRQLLVVNTPRSFRGGLAFVF